MRHLVAASNPLTSKNGRSVRQGNAGPLSLSQRVRKTGLDIPCPYAALAVVETDIGEIVLRRRRHIRVAPSSKLSEYLT